MSLSPADIIAIIQAGGAVDIEPNGAVRITPAKKEGKASRSERNRRYYESRVKATESVLKPSETSENVLIQTPPSPPLPPSPTPPTPRTPTPVHAQGAREAGDLFGKPDSPKPPHRRIAWDPEAGWTGIQEADHEKFREAAPACDIPRQLSAADLWLRANPTKAKKQNFYRFFVNWLSRQQERGGDTSIARTVSRPPPKAEPYGPVQHDKWKLPYDDDEPN